MEVVIANAAGFCYGVRRALELVTETAQAEGRLIYTLGPLIHNPQVVERLAHDGVGTAGDVGEVPSGSIVIVPSHGAPSEVISEARAAGLDVVDATCPFVRKVHDLAASLHEQGYQVIILGDRGHTEVQGIMSMAGDDALAMSDPAELASHPLKRRVAAVAQTTQTLERYRELVKELAGRAYEVRTYNTICGATADRQKAATDLARDVDVILVVGGRNSANTKRLTEICGATGVPTHHVETAEEIKRNWFLGARKVGITAGASTPDWVVDEVVVLVSAT